MPHDLFVDVSYRGLALGEKLRFEDFAAEEAYLQHPAPMPVGTELVISAGDVSLRVLVSRVSEQVAGVERLPGMFVKPGQLDEQAGRFWEEQVSQCQAQREEAKSSERHSSTQVMEAVPSQDDGSTTQVMDAVSMEDSSSTQVMDAVSADEVAAKAEAKADEAKDPSAGEAGASGKKKKRRRKKRS